MNAIALTVAITCLTAGQSGTAPVAGTWTAQFDGRTFVKLELTTAGGKIAGGLSLGDIEVDEKGALRKVGEMPPTLRPIFDVVQKGSTLTFSRKDSEDSTDVDRFQLRLLDATRAELVLVLTEEDRKEIAAEGITEPKPIVLTRR
jgi:hypothetical protein